MERHGSAQAECPLFPLCSQLPAVGVVQTVPPVGPIPVPATGRILSTEVQRAIWDRKPGWRWWIEGWVSGHRQNGVRHGVAWLLDILTRASSICCPRPWTPTSRTINPANPDRVQVPQWLPRSRRKFLFVFVVLVSNRRDALPVGTLSPVHDRSRSRPRTSLS